MSHVSRMVRTYLPFSDDLNNKIMDITKQNLDSVAEELLKNDCKNLDDLLNKYYEKDSTGKEHCTEKELWKIYEEIIG